MDEAKVGASVRAADETTWERPLVAPNAPAGALEMTKRAIESSER